MAYTHAHFHVPPRRDGSDFRRRRVTGEDCPSAARRRRVHRVFWRLSREIGLRRPGDRTGPRVHDFRHRFAIQTLLGWYREGTDVEQQLPVLSTYLGHACVRDTYWYLSACPELMQEAAQRLDRRWEAKP